MKITTVEYSALFNLGNYENEKITFTATLEDGENPREAITELRAKAVAASAAKYSALARFLNPPNLEDTLRRGRLEPDPEPDEEQAEVWGDSDEMDEDYIDVNDRPI